MPFLRLSLSISFHLEEYMQLTFWTRVCQISRGGRGYGGEGSLFRQIALLARLHFLPFSLQRYTFILK